MQYIQKLYFSMDYSSFFKDNVKFGLLMQHYNTYKKLLGSTGGGGGNGTGGGSGGGGGGNFSIFGNRRRRKPFITIASLSTKKWFNGKTRLTIKANGVVKIKKHRRRPRDVEGTNTDIKNNIHHSDEYQSVEVKYIHRFVLYSSV